MPSCISHIPAASLSASKPPLTLSTHVWGVSHPKHRTHVRCHLAPRPASDSAAGRSQDKDEPDFEVQSWLWRDPDAFTPLNDRLDLPPLPLPSLPGQRRRVVLVRHGQSTWNARSRVQGSSDFSVLTQEGESQASTAARLLADWQFDELYASPLKRAAQTATIVWGGRQGPRTALPSLREVDLYSFQGVDKAQGRAVHAEAYEKWQRQPHEFVLDGHAPVRELWHRASIAWQQVLAPGNATHPAPDPISGTLALQAQQHGSILVVAHNAVNQALICTALGLPAALFRRLTQTNAAFSVLDFEWPQPQLPLEQEQKPRNQRGAQQQGSSSTSLRPPPPRVTVQRLNQFSEEPMKRDRLGRQAVDRLILVAGAAGSPAVSQALQLLASSGVEAAPLVGVGSAQDQAADVATALSATLGTPRPPEGRFVLAVASPDACRLLLGMCLGREGVGEFFGMSEGGITMVNYNRGAGRVDKGILLCVNFDATQAAPAAGTT